MNKHLLSTLISLLVFMTGFTQTANLLDRPLQFERSRSYDALNYKIELAVDLETKSFTGTNTITLVPLNSGVPK